MCRLTLYKGRSILIGDVINNPENSLIYQSRTAHYHPGVVDDEHERNILVNGDGFGLGWYSKAKLTSCCFKFVTPAWSNNNLKNIGEHVCSHLFFSHIRAASSGRNPHESVSISSENCHPFKFGSYTFMHNGVIPEFAKIKLSLLTLIAERGLHIGISGSTDSEHIFGLFLYCLPDVDNITIELMTKALTKTISMVIHLCQKAGIHDSACSLNLCVTDGINVLATRFRNSVSEDAPSLYYNYGSQFVCEDGNFYSKGDPCYPTDVVISSAPLSRVHQPRSPSVDGPIDDHPSKVTSPCTTASSSSSSSSSCSSSSCSSSSSSPPSFSCSSSSPSSLSCIQPKLRCHAVRGRCLEAVGEWVVIPNNHMLICQGEACSENVVKIDLQPIEICDTLIVKKNIRSMSDLSDTRIIISSHSRSHRSQIAAPRTPPYLRRFINGDMNAQSQSTPSSPVRTGSGVGRVSYKPPSPVDALVALEKKLSPIPTSTSTSTSFSTPTPTTTPTTTTTTTPTPTPILFPNCPLSQWMRQTVQSSSSYSSSSCNGTASSVVTAATATATTAATATAATATSTTATAIPATGTSRRTQKTVPVNIAMNITPMQVVILLVCVVVLSALTGGIVAAVLIGYTCMRSDNNCAACMNIL